MNASKKTSNQADAAPSDVLSVMMRAEPQTESGTPLSFSDEEAYETDGEILSLLRVIRQENDPHLRSDAFSTLIDRYRPLITRMISRYAGSADLQPADRQELEEEACIALYHAARFYRTGTHATFGYFARVCIKNRLISFLRKQPSPAEPLPSSSEALPSAASTGIYPGVLTVGDIGTEVAERDAFRALFDRFLSTLTEYERRVFHRYVKGKSYKSIAGELGVPIKSVDNAVYRIRVKLKQQLQDQ